MAFGREVLARATLKQTSLVMSQVRRASKPRQLQLPSDALRRPAPSSASARAPLLALLDRGEVRFKLYLWLRWYSQHSPDFEPAPVRLSHVQWALLLALPEPETNGIKRVSLAMAQLEQRGLVTRSSGRPAAVKPTDVPWWPVDRERPHGGYAALPVNFFIGQWIGGLSGQALASLVVLIDRANPRISMPNATLGPATYIPESVLEGTYGISEDLYRQGRQELERVQLVSSRLNKRWSGEASDWSGVESTLDVAKLRSSPHPNFR